jgi:tetratricopeptide (TPR) repeat protein
LYLLKTGVTAAEEVRDELRQERYIDAAILFFPSNAWGYLEKAKLSLSRGSLHGAEVVLRKGPNTATIRRAREFLGENGGQALAKPSLISKEDSAFVQSNDPQQDAKARAIEAIDALRPLYDEAMSKQAWEMLRQAAARTAKLFPFISAGYYFGAVALEALQRMPEAIRVLEAMPSAVTRNTDFQLLLAQLYRKQGNDIGAMRALLLAQVTGIRDHRVRFRISDLYRDDGDNDRAYTYIKAAEILNPQYGAVRRLSFEVDHEMFDEGRETLGRILEFNPSQLLRFLPMVNRVSPFYPDQTAVLKRTRDKVKKALWSASSKSSRELSRNVELAIGCRWIHDAQKLAALGCDKGITLETESASWLTRVEKDLGALVDLIEIAWNNEHSCVLVGMAQGTPQEVRSTSFAKDKMVELFIPTPFFSKPAEEKPTYASVREVFSRIGNYLLEREDLLIVPRLQLNWRYCKPWLEGRSVSYHTRGAQSDRRHLRVQESPLFGHCSLDDKGFAGFASIATDHEKIESAVGKLSRAALEKNHEEMFEHFVNQNISKYTQPSTNQELPSKYVFVAMQIPTDVVARLAWLDGIALLQGVVDFYSGSDTKIVVKRHPYCGSMSVQRTLKEFSERGDVILTNNSIHDVISGAQAVFVVNSGVGLEALMHLKPVIVSGQCDYSYGVHSVRSTAELRQTLERGFELNNRRALELLYYYFNIYTVPANESSKIGARLEEWLSEPI